MKTKKLFDKNQQFSFAERKGFTLCVPNKILTQA